MNTLTMKRPLAVAALKASSLPPLGSGGLWITPHLNVNDAIFRQVWSIYNHSFSDFERRQYLEQLQVMQKPRYRFSALCTATQVVGVLGCWSLDGWLFIEHLAIAATQRSCGYGHAVLQLLQKYAGQMVLDVEPCQNSIQAVRRVAFYQQNGFHYNENAITLPPYHAKTTEPSNWMSWPFPLSARRAASVMSLIEHEVYGVEPTRPLCHVT